MPSRGKKSTKRVDNPTNNTPKKDIDRISFLSELDRVSKSKNKSIDNNEANDFSVKNRKKSTNSILSSSNDINININELVDSVDPASNRLSNTVWDKIMSKYEDMSPIDDITRDGMLSYKRRGDGDKYDTMFNKELSMLNEVLSSLNTASKIVDKKISLYKDKGKTSSGGTMKSFSEIITAQNSLQQTKMQAIKSMADIKKSAEDLRMKNGKINPEIEEDNDSIADNFYKSIINGGRDNFVKNVMSNVNTSQNVDNSDQESNNQGFNITQPSTYIKSTNNESFNDIDYEEDEFGYIRHENDDVNVCIEKLPDGAMVFIALDKNGNPVDDCELPDDSLIDTISIPPMSSFGYDKFGRKYRIIESGGNVDISDIMDDM